MTLKVKNLTKLLSNILKDFESIIGFLIIGIRADITSRFQVIEEAIYKVD